MDGTHQLMMTDRGKCKITGVEDVISFDDKEAVLDTLKGTLHMKGKGLHVMKLNLDQQEVELDGEVCELAYIEKKDFKKKGESLLDRLFS